MGTLQSLDGLTRRTVKISGTVNETTSYDDPTMYFDIPNCNVTGTNVVAVVFRPTETARFGGGSSVADWLHVELADNTNERINVASGSDLGNVSRYIYMIALFKVGSLVYCASTYDSSASGCYTSTIRNLANFNLDNFRFQLEISRYGGKGYCNIDGEVDIYEL